MAKNKNLLDLSHKLDTIISVYPGTPPPSLSNIATIENDGYAETHMAITTHMATHIDAPAHIKTGGKAIYDFPVDHFIGTSLKITCPPTREISKDLLMSYNLKGSNVDFIILASGWYRKWGQPGYLQDYPVLSYEAAEFICDLSVKGVGIDCLSVDRLEDEDLPIHHVLFRNDLVIIENLNNLYGLPDHIFELYALPLYIHADDAAPARVVAKW